MFRCWDRRHACHGATRGACRRTECGPDGKSTEQPQRDSNPCLHLETVAGLPPRHAALSFRRS